jgi:dissimilatory sulfite reductase (desulfoviridin) alpha/beta subunit
MVVNSVVLVGLLVQWMSVGVLQFAGSFRLGHFVPRLGWGRFSPEVGLCCLVGKLRRLPLVVSSFTGGNFVV